LLACDDTMKMRFVPDANTTVTLVKAFAKGDPLALPGTPAAPAPPLATDDLCLVKLRVGPGHPGPPDAPSTSEGIGIEIWLPTPAHWNRRLHAFGGAGWSGGTSIASTAVIGDARAAGVAGSEGAVTSTTDTGHAGMSGSFAMNPDGTINGTLWTDFAYRAVHEMAQKARTLATGYYGASPAFSYWEGCSTGGRQGIAEALAYPADFDGILAGAPAISWSQFTVAGMYPQVVMNLETAGPLPAAKQATAGRAAIAACDTRLTGAHDGYLSDASCAYDPTLDPAVLCTGSGGTNSGPACLTTAEARAMNKFWYGPTVDGSVPPAAVDSGADATLTGRRLWYGLARGTDLAGLTGTTPVDLGSDQLALNLQNPTYATPTFVNAIGNGADKWRALGYAGPTSYAYAFAQGIALDAAFGGVNTKGSDLSAFRDRGGKLIVYHGLADTLVPVQGSIAHYERVAATMGGYASVQQFERLFLVPGMGHCSGIGSLSTGSPPPNPPLPAPGQLFGTLVSWVESGTAPSSIVASSGGASPRLRPLCMYPDKLTYVGGDADSASSFACR